MTTVERIDAVLKRRGMSRRQLAIIAGIPTSSLQAAMARGKNMTVEMLQTIASALNLPISSLLGEANTSMEESVQKIFISRLLEVLRLDGSTASGAYENPQPYSGIVNGNTPVTIEDAERIADEMGVTLDYLTGRTDEPRSSTISLKDYALEMEIEDSDDELIATVHRICGMDCYAIASDYASGKLSQVWDHRKIDMIREFLEDNEPTIQKLLSLSFPSPQSKQEAQHGEHQED